MAGKVVVGCKLPHGIVLELPKDPSKKVALNGLNKATIIGADHATTEVDADFWEAWKAGNSQFGPFKAGAIFFAKNVAEVQAVAKELKEVKTGFERTSRDPKKNGGVKPADKDE